MHKKTIKEIADRLAKTTSLSHEEIEQLRRDERIGVQKLLERYLRKQEKEKALREQYEHMLVFEKKCLEKGWKLVAGIDEAGRGPLAGPVVAAAVILNPDAPIYGLNDSKQLTARQRKGLAQEIEAKAVAIGIAVISAKEIDDLNIYQASRRAMEQAVAKLPVTPDALLIDAMKIETDIPQLSIVKGDGRSVSIASASIMAKVTRDQMMEDLGRRYPEYGFDRHMGYGTKEHLEAIQKYGPCPEHRLSFSPFKTG